MKNLILLFLVIGAVVSTDVALTTTGEIWTLTYNAVTGTDVYSFGIKYDNAATSATTVIANAKFIGVICFPVASDFVLTVVDAVSAARPAFAITTLAVTSAAASAATLGADWNGLALTYLPAAYLSTTTQIKTLTSFTACILDPADGAPTLNSTDFTLSWTRTVAAKCGNLPSMGTTWYAKCYAMSSANGVDLVADGATVTVGNGLDVTFSAPTACAVSAGASTFATGATILAGIAYLQF
jgi:hypothetical protein